VAPRPGWLRVVSLLGGLVLLVLAWVVLAFFSVPSRAGGWLPTTLVLLLPLLALTLGAGIGRRWWGSVATAVVVALLVGGWAYRTAPPDPGRLAALARDVGVPAGWREVSAMPGGSTWGLFGDWPHFDAVYAVPGAPRSAAEAFTARLEADGWHRDEGWANPSRADAPWTYQVWRDGPRTVTLNVEPPGGEGRRYDTSVPADRTKVSLYYE
jgi:hypothetical protein